MAVAAVARATTMAVATASISLFATITTAVNVYIVTLLTPATNDTVAAVAVKRMTFRILCVPLNLSAY